MMMVVDVVVLVVLDVAVFEVVARRGVVMLVDL